MVDCNFPPLEDTNTEVYDFKLLPVLPECERRITGVLDSCKGAIPSLL